MDLGIFSDDKFSLEALTAAINEAPARPSRLATLGLFTEEGIQTTSFNVERDVDTLTLVPNTARTAEPAPTGGSSRSLVSFLTTHLPTQDKIVPDDIQNLRAFGRASELETMQYFVARRLAKMRRRLEATIEYQRVGAIKGKVIDSDGVTVISDIVKLFGGAGAEQPTYEMPLADDTKNLRGEFLGAVDIVESALGNEPYSGLRVLCGKDFFRSLIKQKSVVEAYDRWQQGEFLRNDPRNGFAFAGATFEEYRGAIGGTPFIADAEAYLFPEGVEDMFLTRFAPANYTETANTIGLPFYSKQEAVPLKKGILLEAQSNPISLCTRPFAVVRLTIKA